MNQDTKLRIKRIAVIIIILLVITGLITGSYFLMKNILPTSTLCPDGQKTYGDSQTCYNTCSDNQEPCIHRDKSGKIIDVICMDKCPNGEIFDADTCKFGIDSACHPDCSKSGTHSIPFFDKGTNKWLCGQGCPNVDDDDPNIPKSPDGTPVCAPDTYCEKASTLYEDRSDDKTYCQPAPTQPKYCSSNPEDSDYLVCGDRECATDGNYCQGLKCDQNKYYPCSSSQDCIDGAECTNISTIDDPKLKDIISKKGVGDPKLRSNISICSAPGKGPSDISISDKTKCVFPSQFATEVEGTEATCTSSAEPLGINAEIQCGSPNPPCTSTTNLCSNGWQLKDTDGNCSDSLKPLDLKADANKKFCCKDGHYDADNNSCCIFPVSDGKCRNISPNLLPQDTRPGKRYDGLAKGMTTDTLGRVVCKNDDQCSQMNENLKTLITPESVKDQSSPWYGMSPDVQTVDGSPDLNYTNAFCGKKNSDDATGFCQLAAGYVYKPTFTYSPVPNDDGSLSVFSEIWNNGTSPYLVSNVSYNTPLTYRDPQSDFTACISSQDAMDYINDPKQSKTGDPNNKFYWTGQNLDNVKSLTGRVDFSFSQNGKTELPKSDELCHRAASIPGEFSFIPEHSKISDDKTKCHVYFDCSSIKQFESTELKDADYTIFDNTDLGISTVLYPSKDAYTKCTNASAPKTSSENPTYTYHTGIHQQPGMSVNCPLPLTKASDGKGQMTCSLESNSGESYNVGNNYMLWLNEDLPKGVDGSKYYKQMARFTTDNNVCRVSSIEPNMNSKPTILQSGELAYRLDGNTPVNLSTIDGIQLCPPEAPNFDLSQDSLKCFK